MTRHALIHPLPPSCPTNQLQAAREKLVTPEIFRFTPPNSSVELYGALYRPNPAIHGPGPYPTVVSVYGGPNAQKVHRYEIEI
jgi:dipeptidyl-peptidase-4